MNIKFADGWNTPAYGESMVVSVDLETDEVVVSSEPVRKSGDGTPIREWHGIERNYGADNGDGRVDCDALREYIAGDGQALIARILSGGSREWNGSNHVGCMTDDAQDAEMEFSQALTDLPRSNVVDWTCDEWFDQVMGDIRTQPTEQDAREFGENSTDPNVVLDCDPGDWCAQEWRWHHAAEAE